MLPMLNCYQLNIGCYKYKVFYISITVTTKEKPAVDTQKIMIKESMHNATKHHQITNEVNMRGNKKQNSQKPTKWH